MTKKDYVAIAKILSKELYKHDNRITMAPIAAIANRLAECFEADNPNFDSTRFLNACYQEY